MTVRNVTSALVGVLLVVFFALWPVSHAADGPRKADFVSMIALIAVPEKYDGQTVLSSGYLKVFGLEATLYFSKEDGNVNNMLNAVSIDVPKALEATLTKYHNHYVMIYGQFSKRTPSQISAGTLRVEQINHIKR